MAVVTSDRGGAVQTDGGEKRIMIWLSTDICCVQLSGETMRFMNCAFKGDTFVHLEKIQRNSA